MENHKYWFIFSGIDKVIHLSIFAFLSFCFWVSFPKIKFITFILVMLLYGLITEILQDEMHWGRSMEIGDLVADIIGTLIGYFIYTKIKALKI